MKLWNILRTVGSAALQVALPGTGSIIVGAVNALLPKDKQLPEAATAPEMEEAIASLPAADRAALMDKEFDVDITRIKETNSTVREMLRSDAAMQQTTRPYIAKHSFHVIALTVLAAVGLWGFAVYTGNLEMVRVVVEGWPFLAAVVGPLVTLLWAYFGVLKQEQKQKLDAAGGNTSVSRIAGLLKVFKK